MANTLTITSLLENIFRAKDTVAKEVTGYIQGCLINSSKEGASINGTITSMRTAQPTLNTSITPSMTIPNGDDQTISADTLILAQTANVKIPLVGETVRQLENTVGGQAAIDDLFTQAIRTARNAIEAHVGNIIQLGASRATGTSATTPFASTISAAAQARKILIDNGTPDDGMLSLVLDTAAGANLRSIPNLYKVNEAGTDVTLRRGELLNMYGLSIRESAGVKNTTAGTGASYVLNGALSAGATAITVQTGTGTILAGDVITIGAFQYVVQTALASNIVTIARPGLRAAAANNATVTVNAAYTANSCFHRNSVELVMRPPAQPFGGDAAVDTIDIADGTGLVYQIAQYKGYKMAMWDLTVYYQAKVWKPEFVATLLG